MYTLRRHVTIKGIGLVAVLLLLSSLSHSQQVIGVSAILNSTSSTQIDTYSATELDAAAAYYYDAGVDGYLFKNGSLIAWSSVNAGSYAYRYMSAPLQVGNIYQLESDHWLVQYFAYYYNGYNWYSNPYGFGYACGSCGGGYPSGYGFLPSGGPAYYSMQDIYLGTTAVAISSAAPNITSSSPGGASRGTSGSLTLQGTNLMDLWTQTTTPAITGSGVSVSVQSASSSQVVLNYTVASNASTGGHNVTVATRFGTSNSVTFNVGDRTPVVQSVSPSTWPAGANTTVTLTGTGFGTNPTVSTTGTGISLSVSSATDTQISMSVSVAANAPDQNITVQVQSNGYTGSGFIATNQGQSSTGSNSASVQAIAAPAPQIMFEGADVTGTTKSVVVGQKIELSRTVNVPAGLSIASESWSTPSGSAVGGYNASTSSGSVQALPPANTSTYAYYWVDSGSSRQMTYTYSLSNGKSNSANVTFNVAGPSGVNIATTTGSVSIVNFGTLQMRLFGVQVTPTGTNGIKFVASASLPSGNQGTYSWVQLIKKDENTFVQYDGKHVCNPSILAGGPVLDNHYPYSTVNTTGSGPANDTASDGPGTTLIDGQGSLPLNPGRAEQTRHFSAKMHLLWTPNASASCSSGSCTVPVPLAAVDWELKYSAFNSLVTDASQQFPSTWKISCGQGTQNPQCSISNPSADPQNKGYPTWQATFTNGNACI